MVASTILSRPKFTGCLLRLSCGWTSTELNVVTSVEQFSNADSVLDPVLTMKLVWHFLIWEPDWNPSPGSLIKLRSGSQSSLYHFLVPLVLLLTSIWQLKTFFSLEIWQLWHISAHKIICILLTEICFWVMVVHNFAPKKTLVRNQELSENRFLLCIYENRLIWEPGEIEKYKNLISWPVLTSPKQNIRERIRFS
jgi:hypothetical protein